MPVFRFDRRLKYVGQPPCLIWIPAGQHRRRVAVSERERPGGCDAVARDGDMHRVPFGGDGAPVWDVPGPVSAVSALPVIAALVVWDAPLSTEMRCATTAIRSITATATSPRVPSVRRRDGRVLQEVISLPAGSQQPAQDAVNAGYAAGSNNAFGGYDGGWTRSNPVRDHPGTGKIAHRLLDRFALTTGAERQLLPVRRGT